MTIPHGVASSQAHDFSAQQLVDDLSCAADVITSAGPALSPHTSPERDAARGLKGRGPRVYRA